MPLKTYWGDLHSHCAISYGHGTVAQALARARQQLDFCSVTGHAFWPDMPTDRAQYAEIIDYHHEGFARLARNWPELIATQAAASQPESFLVFPSYEWHSLAFGDHNVYGCDPELALLDAPNIDALKDQIRDQDRLAIPHHIGYRSGYRGINWDAYQETCSPFVEIFSLHGCSLSDEAPYPMLHDMGPRDFGSTAEAGWQRGFHFGIVGGTDHHAAYPGSHGDGRMGVLADQLTRPSLWEAFKARRVFAATGDKIDADFTLNDAPIGSILEPQSERKLRIRIQGMDTLSHVELKKNGHPYRIWGVTGSPPAAGDETRGRLRLTWGWGRKTETTHWEASFKISDGEIEQIDPCFSGQAIVAPQTDKDGSDGLEPLPDLPHAILDQTPRSLHWRSVTQGNLTMRHPTTQALSLRLKAPESARVEVRVNGHAESLTLAELKHGARTHFLRGWLSEAIQIGRWTPLNECHFETEFTDEPESPCDRYQVNIAQKNGQWAWLSPIWVRQ